MQKDGTDRFIIPAYNGKAVFIRNTANEVIGIKIEALGFTSKGSIEKNQGSKKITKSKSPTPSKVLLPKWFDEPDDLYSY
ncbi:MAG: hypothetical protein IPJ81_04960 [Chitinophagaceae bacterium]|nr:hypothetical protein [Chitinophagaceae bacterium]